MIPEETCLRKVDTRRPELPLDLHCDSNCTETSPTFWTGQRYTQVDMCVKGAHGGNCAQVDSVKLTHSLEDADGNSATTDDTKLFLTGLQRTGYDPGPPQTDPAPDSSITLPPVTFTPVMKLNRHLPGTESAMPHFRIGSVKDEFGRQVDVTYDTPHECPDPLPVPPTWDANTANCFPQMWAPTGGTPTFRAFNKYVVTKVEVTDTTGGSPDMVTDYFYGDMIDDTGGAPQTWSTPRDQPEAAWHHDMDPYLPQAYQSWSEWRGYQDVLVVQGTTRTRYKVFRGMDDDQIPTGTRTVNLTSFDGTVTDTPDSNWLAGRVLDQMSLRADGSPEHGTVHGFHAVKTVDVPCTPSPACEDTQLADARFVAENDTVVRRRTPAGGTVFRRQRTQTTFNGDHQPEDVIEHGWTDGPAGDERCTRTEYATNTTTYLLDYPERVTRYDNGTTCSGTAIGRTETAYDGLAVGAAPTEGSPTTSRVQISTSPSPAGTWSTTSTTYDALGRAHEVTDPNGHTTTTTYGDLSDDPGFPDRVRVTNHLGHQTDTRLVLVRQIPLWTEDANDKRTTYAYDALGRVTSVVQPTEAATGDASWQFSYDIEPDRDEVPVIRTRQLQDGTGSGARYLDSWVLYDSLLRERQTHTPSPESGKVIVANTTYHGRGLVATTNVPEAVTATAGDALVATPGGGWGNRTETSYDHLGRGTETEFYASATLQRTTATSYTHDSVVVDPEVGGNTRTTSDGLGRSIEVAEHDGTAYRATTYSYDMADRLVSVTDPADNTIAYTYDMAGRRTAMDDPDAGDWQYGYDPAGNQTSVTDALTETVHTVYDELNRPTHRRQDNPTTGPVLATWDYDNTGELGLLDRSTRHQGADQWVVDVTGYDDRNRPTGREWDIPASLIAFTDYTVTYGYDAADHPTTVGYPAVGSLAAETVTTTYDDLGLPDLLTGATGYVSVSAYDNRGRPSLFGYGSPTLHMGKHWAYDSLQRLSHTQTAATIGNVTQTRDIGYDQADNVTERDTDLAGAAFKECFGYDQRHRLTTAYTTTPATDCSTATNKGTGAHPYNHTYTYTHDGNLLSRTEGATTIDYTYPTGGPSSVRPHAPTDVGNDDYTWNANGNQATRTVGGQLNTLEWDTEHRLAAVDDPDGDSSFTYDADGNRLLRQTPIGTTLYIEGHEITAPTGGGPLTAVRSYAIDGQPVATRTPTGLDYLVTDNQGTLEQTIPAGSTTAEHTRTYLPYGKLRTGGQPDTDHTWIGQIEDDSTQLSYLNARYYDPSAGVFTAPDPLADSDRPRTLNPYGYAIGNPVGNIDPDGTIPLECTTKEISCRTVGRSGLETAPSGGLIDEDEVATLLPDEYETWLGAEGVDLPVDLPLVSQNATEAEWAMCGGWKNIGNLFSKCYITNATRLLVWRASPRNDPENARVHMILSALTTIMAGDGDIAKDLLDAHENIYKGELYGEFGANRQMDLINNRLGMRIGMEVLQGRSGDEDADDMGSAIGGLSSPGPALPVGDISRSISDQLISEQERQEIDRLVEHYIATETAVWLEP